MVHPAQKEPIAPVTGTSLGIISVTISVTGVLANKELVRRCGGHSMGREYTIQMV